MARVYVQYGCGASAPEGWINFDASFRLKMERSLVLRQIFRLGRCALFPANVRLGDVTRRLPLPTGDAAGVYASHVLEHLPRGSVEAALKETIRILAPGGRFRLIVPDLEWRVRQYLDAVTRGEAGASDQLLTSCLLGKKAVPSGFLSLARALYGRSEHLWMYDWLTLKALLEKTGFVRVRRCAFGDAGDPMFDLVEDRARYFEGNERELAIEAFKPGTSQ